MLHGEGETDPDGDCDYYEREEQIVMTEKQLKKMVAQYLENGDFEVSEYAKFEFAGLTAMLASRWAVENLEQIDFDASDFSGLSDYAHEKAKCEGLEAGRDYR